jgi:hypothetical protein
MKNMYQTEELLMKGQPDLSIQTPQQAFTSEGKWLSSKINQKTGGVKKPAQKGRS